MTPFIAQIQPFAFNFAPRGWQLCNGQLIAISQFSAVFSLVGTTFGGDGRTTFGLPDLRGRSMVGVGSGPGLEHRQWGQRGGRNSVQLTVSQLPAHNHTLNAFNGPGDSRAPGGDLSATSSSGDFMYKKNSAPNTTMQSNAIGNTGGNIAVDIDNPFLGLYIGFAMEGIYPSRS